MYDYVNNMYDDILNAIVEGDYDRQIINSFNSQSEDYDLDGVFDSLYDDMFLDDGITGNGSGSYFFNAYKAQEAIKDNLALADEAYDSFGITPTLSSIVENPEAVDVTIRCHLLNSILRDVLESDDIREYLDDLLKDIFASESDEDDEE